MTEVARNKGQFVQPGTPHIVPKIDGSFMSVDGMVDFGELLVQADYPVLFQVLGIAYNKEGDDPNTEFRMPDVEDWGLPTLDSTKAKWMIRI